MHARLFLCTCRRPSDSEIIQFPCETPREGDFWIFKNGFCPFSKNLADCRHAELVIVIVTVLPRLPPDAWLKGTNLWRDRTNPVPGPERLSSIGSKVMREKQRTKHTSPAAAAEIDLALPTKAPSSLATKPEDGASFREQPLSCSPPFWGAAGLAGRASERYRLAERKLG